MPRRLSNIEWATFLAEVDVPALNLPPWGGVIDWRGLKVLVFQGVDEIFLTDVSSDGEALANLPDVYDSRQELWWYRLPEETAGVLWERADQFDAVVRTAAATLAAPSTWVAAIVIGGLVLFMLSKHTVS